MSKNNSNSTAVDIDTVDDITNSISKVVIFDGDVPEICANCGKEGGNLKSCTACNLVKYCNRECQIAHRSMHKKECRKRAAELKETDSTSVDTSKRTRGGDGVEMYTSCEQKTNSISGTVSKDLRFTMGDKVLCRTGQHTWEKGVIVMLWYVDGKPGMEEVVHPYQIRLLGSDVHVYAPVDSDLYVTTLRESEDDINGVSADSVNKMAISDDKLFADPPPKEDCPICMLPMPFASGLCGVSKTYQPCCGKTICEGCDLASAFEVMKGNLKELCSFCRVPSHHRSDKEQVQRFEERMKLNDACAFRRLGDAYSIGEWGLPKNSKKAFELWTKAAELGSLDAHYQLARAYHSGKGVEFDEEKSIHHYKTAAIRGDEYARHALGLFEAYKRNNDRAMKHFMIAARSGNGESLKVVGEGYKRGHVTKDEYAKILRAHQRSCGDIHSEQRMKPQQIRDNPGNVRQILGGQSRR